MKLKLTFLLLASVFFVSCGMPKIFNIPSDSYILETYSPTVPIPNSVSGTMEIATSNLSILSDLSDSHTTGPSLMFFYSISGESLDTYFSNVREIFREQFKTKIKKEPFGLSNPKYQELIFKNLDDGKKVSLYGFTGEGGKHFTVPEYILSTNSSNNPKLDHFTLEAKQDLQNNSQYYVQLTVGQDSPPGSFQPSSINLLGLNNSLFFTKNEDIINHQTGEYDYLPDAASEIYLNIFCAFSITGNFANSFWSTLEYLGQIKLPF